VARYIDPIDTMYVEAPTGWCLDRFSSLLTHLIFVPWNSPDESLRLNVRPPEIPPEAPLDQWLHVVVRGVPAGAPLARVDSTDGMAVVATLNGAHGITRVAFVRGLRLVATVEHRGARNDAASVQILRDAVASLFVAVNHHFPGAQDKACAGQFTAEFSMALARSDTVAAY
jgi:hypothetical protein